jgi:transcriptional repressor NrdR
MRCPFCGSDDTQVKDSRSTEDGSAIRRRRFCPQCHGRFTTFERVQLRELMVIKKTGERRPFDREKVNRAIKMAVRKRSIGNDQIDHIVAKIERKLESLGEIDIPTSMIGDLIMEALADLDQVAYVRFASVYKDFSEAKDFEKFIKQLQSAS